jgi:hypothetical protein
LRARIAAAASIALASARVSASSAVCSADGWELACRSAWRKGSTLDKGPGRRRVDPGDLVHGSVTPRESVEATWHLNPPDGCGVVGDSGEPLGRFPNVAAWFALIGAIDRTELFRIGSGCEHTPQRSGEFSCFANDAWFKYGNNRGVLRLDVRRVG